MAKNPPGGAPGWYPDPAGRNDERYWDGAAWTIYVKTGGVEGIDPRSTPLHKGMSTATAVILLCLISLALGALLLVGACFASLASSSR